MLYTRITFFAIGCALWLPGSSHGATEFCLRGDFDLAARYQGMTPAPEEWYPAEWCVTTESESSRTLLSMRGRSNPDLDGSWSVAYLPPQQVRVVRDGRPDLLFVGTDNADEALSARRIDPRRLVAELLSNPEGIEGLSTRVVDGKLQSVTATADVPLRGRVAVRWEWEWADPQEPVANLYVAEDLLFRARGRWRKVPEADSADLWKADETHGVVEVDGDKWPAATQMDWVNLTDDLYLVTGVRAGFRHLVIDSLEGLIIGDAPAGWVEFHHLPPRDLVPGDGISGLSQKMIGFIRQQLPDRPLRAVILTHFHDDHAGGARPFAAAGAEIYAPQKSAEFLGTSLNDPSMPPDRLSESQHELNVIPVRGEVRITTKSDDVVAVQIGPNPHAHDMIGLWAKKAGYFFVSDIHVPSSDAPTPRADRAETECWFARWAVEHLPMDVEVINSHSAATTPVKRLRRYTEAEACAQPPAGERASQGDDRH